MASRLVAFARKYAGHELAREITRGYRSALLAGDWGRGVPFLGNAWHEGSLFGIFRKG